MATKAGTESKDGKGTAGAQAVQLINSLTVTVNELKAFIENEAAQNKIRHTQHSNSFNELEAKIAALAAGKKTTTRAAPGTKKAGDAASGSPQGPKKYTSPMYYLKNEYGDNKDKFREYLDEDAIADIDAHMTKSTKKGVARDKYEAGYIWTNYVKKVKEDDADVEKVKLVIRNAVAADLKAFNAETEGGTSTAGEKE
jgi:hypothetical protein